MMIDNISLSQSKIFLEREGDCWFERNERTLSNKIQYYETHTIKRVLQSYKENINAILEVGCGNGVKLEDLCKFFNASGAGIDPSASAVENGNQRIRELENQNNFRLERTTASKLPYNNATFDLVYFGFCLYLVDRNEIFNAVAEADRVLKNGGFLAILDFDPAQRHKRPYHHKSGLFSYKTSYSDFFINCGHYYLVAKESFSHSENNFSLNSDERVSICVLYKEVDPY